MEVRAQLSGGCLAFYLVDAVSLHSSAAALFSPGYLT